MAIPLRCQHRAEFRKAVRHPVQLPAYETSDAQSEPSYCVIHDISLKGARLTFDDLEQIPDSFTLVFSRTCHAVRRADGEIGVEWNVDGWRVRLQKTETSPKSSNTGLLLKNR